MPNCDMCGQETEDLVIASIEGVELSVCARCAKFGKILRKQRPQQKEEKKPREIRIPKRAEIIQIISEDYANKIKNAREKMFIKQEDLAKRINEKESLIQHIESGKSEPNIYLARKLDKFLNITLVEQNEEKHEDIKGHSSEGFTLGDFIKVRKKQ